MSDRTCMHLNGIMGAFGLLTGWYAPDPKVLIFLHSVGAFNLLLAVILCLLIENEL